MSASSSSASVPMVPGTRTPAAVVSLTPMCRLLLPGFRSSRWAKSASFGSAEATVAHRRPPSPCGPWERWEGWGRRLPPMETCAAAAAILVALAQQLWHLRNIRAAPACDGAPQYGRRARGGCSPCTLTARAGAHRAALGPGRARSCSRQRCARRGENRFQRQPAKPPTFVRAVVGKRISRIRLQEGY